MRWIHSEDSSRVQGRLPEVFSASRVLHVGQHTTGRPPSVRPAGNFPDEGKMRRREDLARLLFFVPCETYCAPQEQRCSRRACNSFGQSCLPVCESFESLRKRGGASRYFRLLPVPGKPPGGRYFLELFREP